jgi:hypothetical protein
VHGQVADVLDRFDLQEQSRRQIVFERRFVNQRAQRFVIRPLQRRIALVEPFDGQFQRAAGVKTTGARIGVDQTFGLLRGFLQLRPFFAEEVEIRHRLFGRDRMGSIQAGAGAVIFDLWRS